MSLPHIASKPAVAGTKLLGFGSTQGNRIVTNDDLAKLVDTNDEWVRQRVGIIHRRRRWSTWPSSPAPRRSPTRA